MFYGTYNFYLNTLFLYKNQETFVQPELFLLFLAIEAEIFFILFLIFGKNQLLFHKIVLTKDIEQ